MITVPRSLILALAAVLTLFVTHTIGENVDFDAEFDSLLEKIYKSDRGKLEELGSAVSIIKMIHSAEACEKFRVAIDGFEIHGGDAKGKVDSVFDSAFAAIDAAEGDHARKGANLAFDLAKGIGAIGNNPWHLKAGFRVIYANVCERR